jgi:hypothetical protein
LLRRAIIARMSLSLLGAACALELVALVGGRVHTLVPGVAPAERAIVLDGERIQAVCAPAEVPAAARVVDVRGLHIVPGYIDGLAYHDTEHDRLYTLAGVASICDHGNDAARLVGARRPDVRMASMGPEIHTAGLLLDGEPPATSAALVLKTANDVVEAVEHLRELEVSFFATHAQLDGELWRALIVESAKYQLGVFGPRPKGLDLAAVLAAKPRGLVTLDALLPAGKTWDSVSVDELRAAAKEVAAAGVSVIPTLGALSKDLDALDPSSSDLTWLGPNYTSYWLNELAVRKQQMNESLRASREGALTKAKLLLGALHSSGVRLVAGSGAPHPWLMPGEGLHRELAQWQAAGVSAADCLAACTREAALAFGLKDCGVIEAGNRADLVLLSADPTQSVAAMREIAGVVRRGAVLDRARLDALRGELSGWVEAARKLVDAPLDAPKPALPEGQVLISGKCETLSTAGRLAAERFAVVRELDDTLTFCSTRRTPPGISQPELIVHSRQRVRRGQFDSFEVRAVAQGRELVVKGLKAGDQWRVERRFDGGFVDLKAAQEDVVAIDCDSVTTPMLLAVTRKPGGFPVIRFHEGLELEVVRWDMAVNEHGDHGFRTPTGVRLCQLNESGAVKVLVQQLGATQTQTSLVESDTHGGVGLELPADVLAKVRATAAAEARGETPGAKR